ncbi:MAG: cadherin-like domain-containing protein [Sedimentisphaerales bacterium]|nr:cadherin-like domain-containing protein [Sedimentisphaerales bacterium]
MKKRYLRRGIIYFLIYNLILNTWMPAVMAVVPPAPNALPSGGSVPTGFGGVGQFDYSITGELHLRNVAEKTIINWDNFDIGSDALTQFHQLGINPVVLNRIVGGDPTGIFGSLQANGSVFIVNPAGIVFGGGSTINVTQLVASTLGISNGDFMAGNYEFIAGADIGEVVNYGEINAVEGAALIGSRVLNYGTITTGPGGFVVMAAGDRVLLGEPGSKIVVEMDSVTSPDDGIGDVINDGDIESPSGRVVLAAGDIFSSAMELPKVSNGVGRIEQNGTIRTDGTSGDGGQVILTAADEVVLAAGSLTTANAGTGGDSGLIVAHSEDRTIVQSGARIESIGGSIPDSEDVVNTSVEIQGDQVNFAGDVDASASDGKRGKVVIDTFNMTIADGSMPDDPPNNTVYEEWIEQQSQSATDVVLVAHSKTQGNIIVEPINDNEITGGSGDIVLRTKYDTGGITFLPAIQGNPITTAIHTTNGGNIYMLAGAGGITIGDVMTDIISGGALTEPGIIRLYTNNNGHIDTGQLTVNGGSYDEISVLASGNLTINGNVEARTNGLCEEKNHGTAKIYLVSANGNVDIDGTVKARAYGKRSTMAGVLISAGQDVIVNAGANQIEAYAHTTRYNYPADASVSIYAGGVFPRDEGGVATVRVYAKNGTYCDVAEVFSTDPPEEWDQTHGDSHALLEIEEGSSGDVPDCPKPPYIEPIFPVPPVAMDDLATTHMGDPLSGNVLTNDDTGLDVSSYTQPSHGTVTIDENGDYVYTPDPGYADNETPDSFTYIATDGELFTESAAVTINVNNILPSAGDDSATTKQDEAVTIDVLTNDLDMDGDPLSVYDFTYEGGGTLVLNGDGSFSFTPEPGFSGQDSFTYLVTDSQLGGTLSEANVIITVNPAPVVAIPFIASAPGLERIEFDVSGCPALVKWAAAELGIDERVMQIWAVNTLASSQDIQPCNACERLKNVAAVLRDDGGTRIAALAQVIGEYASSTAPPTPEQMASVADVISRNARANNRYAAAGEYVDAIVAYVGVLNNDLAFSTEESIMFAVDKYVAPLAEGQNAGLAAYIAARLATLGGS